MRLCYCVVFFVVASIESQSSSADPLLSTVGLQLGKMDISNCVGTSTPISDQSSVNADQSLLIQGTQFAQNKFVITIILFF